MNFMKIICAIALTLIGQMSNATTWDYKLERNPIDGQHVRDMQTGVEQPYVFGTFPNTARYATMSFTLKSHGYFSENNVGHMVFMVGMKEYIGINHSGHGVIIGNVSGYGEHSGVCAGNPRVNSSSVETFFPNGNCVYPTDTGLTMRDNVEYHVEITVDNTLKTVKTTIVSEYGELYESLVHVSFTDVALRGNYWGLVEVMSEHSWTVYIGDMLVNSHW